MHVICCDDSIFLYSMSGVHYAIDEEMRIVFDPVEIVMI